MAPQKTYDVILLAVFYLSFTHHQYLVQGIKQISVLFEDRNKLQKLNDALVRQMLTSAVPCLILQLLLTATEYR